MNNSTPFKKRSDPFAGSMPSSEKPVTVERTVEREEPKVVAKPIQKTTDESNREKYTATMEKALRKRIKVASALEGIQVSSFIEQACLEKLEREGK